MNRHRLALHAGVKGVDVRLDDPTGPYYLAEDVHQLLRRVQQQRFHTAQCRCWDCDALQKDIAATLIESPAQETLASLPERQREMDSVEKQALYGNMRELYRRDPRPAHTAAHDCACEECVETETPVEPVTIDEDTGLADHPESECEHKWVADPLRPFVRDCQYCGHIARPKSRRKDL